MVNAIEDGLVPLGVRLYEFPLGPHRLWDDMRNVVKVIERLIDGYGWLSEP